MHGRISTEAACVHRFQKLLDDASAFSETGRGNQEVIPGPDNHSHEFSALDDISVFLRSHYPSMRKICPSAEADQAAVRCWVTHRQQQENSECDVEAH